MNYYLSDIEKLKENRAWKELVITIEDRLKLTTEQLIVAGKIDKVRKCQGAIEELKFFLQLPRLIEEDLINNNQGDSNEEEK